MDKRNYNMLNYANESDRFRTEEWWEKISFQEDGLSLAVLEAIARVTNEQYNDYINEVLENDDAWDIPHLRWLRERADTADTRVLLARHKALNECTCDPDPNREGMACEVCRQDIQEKLGDEIPY